MTFAVYCTYDIDPDHCTEPKRRILTTCRQLCSLWRVPSRFLTRVCPSSPSPVRIREPQVHTSWLWHETQEIKTQVLSAHLQVYISSHPSCGVSSPKDSMNIIQKINVNDSPLCLKSLQIHCRICQASQRPYRRERAIQGCQLASCSQQHHWHILCKRSFHKISRFSHVWYKYHHQVLHMYHTTCSKAVETIQFV